WAISNCGCWRPNYRMKLRNKVLPGRSRARRIQLGVAIAPPTEIGATSDVDIDALSLYNQVSSNLPRFEDGRVLIGDMQTGGLSVNQVGDAFADLREQMLPGDTFILFDSSHGGSYDRGSETTLTPGNEFLAIGSNQLLSDDLMTLGLDDMDGIKKWVILDSCRAGGFWGNNNSSDVGDLEKLPNIALISAAAEDKDAYSWPGTDAAGLTYPGEGVLTSALIRAFSRDDEGRLLADADGHGDITLDELRVWLTTEWPREYLLKQTPLLMPERDQGDLVSFTSDMWSPFVAASADFAGSFTYDQNSGSVVPAPSAVLLGGIGLGFASWLCKRRRT
ncbi:MAG: caspase family protein, partial [Phycisphaerae bacterium]|nr:caspase family protein [Phycisphaerae bacterium]